MTTSLVISHPDITYNALTITNSAPSGYGDPENNLTAGARNHYFWIGTSTTLTFDLGLSYASGNSTMDHFIVARADRLQAAVTDVTIKRSSDNVTYITESQEAAFASATLYGPQGDDYIKENTLSSSYRYWQAIITSSLSRHAFSKLYIGKFFDFGTEPNYHFERVPLAESTWYSSSGAYQNAQLNDPVYRFSFEWKGVTDDMVNSFYNKIVKNKHKHGFFLYTRSVHAVLDSQRLVHCRLVDASTYNSGNKADYNTVNAVFEEMLG